MRIVGSQHDYYDVVQSSGQDQTLVYVRSRREECFGANRISLPSSGRYQRYPMNWEFMVIGFCGKIYPFVKISSEKNLSEHTYCHSIEDLDVFMEENLKKKDLESYFSEKNGRLFKYWGYNLSRKDFIKHFSNINDKKDKFLNVFLDNGAPIFRIFADSDYKGTIKIVFNDILKDYDFFRVIDPYTAFQEISMFVGGMANPIKPIPQLSDKDMLIAKGFDNWSFKTPPKGK